MKEKKKKRVANNILLITFCCLQIVDDVQKVLYDFSKIQEACILENLIH